MSGRGQQAIVVLAPGSVALRDEPVRPPADGQFRVETRYTGVSAGTELTFVKGTNPYLHRCWDPRLGAFVDGDPAGYPVTSLGYMEVGTVVESRTGAVAPGQLVAMTYGHRTGCTATGGRDLAVPLPGDLDPLLGIYVAQMGPICANGLLHATHDLDPTRPDDLGLGVRDRRVLVTGAGAVGLLTALFARHHGAGEVVVADPTPERLAIVEALGLVALDTGEPDGWRALKERWAPGADVAFQCRGQAASLALALRCLRPQGSVIDLAFYQGGADAVRLGEELHHNALSIRGAQINRVPRGFDDVWDRRRLAAATLDLLAVEGEAMRRTLVTDVVPFADGPRFLEDLAARRRSTVQAVLECPPVE